MFMQLYFSFSLQIIDAPTNKVDCIYESTIACFMEKKILKSLDRSVRGEIIAESFSFRFIVLPATTARCRFW